MKDMMRRLTAILMSLMLLFASLPFAAIAEAAGEVSDPAEPIVDESSSFQLISNGIMPLDESVPTAGSNFTFRQKVAVGRGTSVSDSDFR